MPACFLLGITACRPEKICTGVTSGVTASGEIKTRLGSKGAVFYLPAAGGFGSVGVLSSHLSLGEAAQWTQLAICAGGADERVALAGGQAAAGAGGFCPASLSKAHSSREFKCVLHSSVSILPFIPFLPRFSYVSPVRI